MGVSRSRLLTAATSTIAKQTINSRARYFTMTLENNPSADATPLKRNIARQQADYMDLSGLRPDVSQILIQGQ